MNETQLRYCDIRDKTISNQNKSKHGISKSHKREKGYGAVFKEYEAIRPENNDVIHILNDTFDDCRTKKFHSVDFG